MKINFLFTGEGSSDLKLVDHIENLLIEIGFDEVSGEAPDLGMFRIPVGRSVKDKVKVLMDHYPNTDLIFIHRDADNKGPEIRKREIMQAIEGVVEREKVIPVIPVTMLETWLLADKESICRVAGGSDIVRLACIPPAKKLESEKNSKDLLLRALCEASEESGGRLKKFKKRFGEMRARLVYELDPEGPVTQLNSYQDFRRSIEEFFEHKYQAAP